MLRRYFFGRVMTSFTRDRDSFPQVIRLGVVLSRKKKFWQVPPYLGQSTGPAGSGDRLENGTETLKKDLRDVMLVRRVSEKTYFFNRCFPSMTIPSGNSSFVKVSAGRLGSSSTDSTTYAFCHPTCCFFFRTYMIQSRRSV